MHYYLTGYFNGILPGMRRVAVDLLNHAPFIGPVALSFSISPNMTVHEISMIGYHYDFLYAQVPRRENAVL